MTVLMKPHSGFVAQFFPVICLGPARGVSHWRALQSYHAHTSSGSLGDTFAAQIKLS